MTIVHAKQTWEIRHQHKNLDRCRCNCIQLCCLCWKVLLELIILTNIFIIHYLDWSWQHLLHQECDGYLYQAYEDMSRWRMKADRQKYDYRQSLYRNWVSQGIRFTIQKTLIGTLCQNQRTNEKTCNEPRSDEATLKEGETGTIVFKF